MTELTPEERACRAMCVCRANGQLGTAYHTDNCAFIQWPKVHKQMSEELRNAVAAERTLWVHPDYGTPDWRDCPDCGIPDVHQSVSSFLRCRSCAVAAQKEKDAKTNPADIACPNKSCHQEKHFPCVSHNTGLIPCHPERWQAAIRAGGDDE